MRDDRRGALQRLLPQLAIGQVIQRVGLEQVQRRELALGEALGDRASIPTGRVVRLAEPRAGVRQHPGLAQAAPVGAGRDFQQARALDLAHARAQAAISSSA